MRHALDWLADRLPWWLDWRHFSLIVIDRIELRVIRGECPRVDLVRLREWTFKAYSEMREVHGAVPAVILRVRGQMDPKTNYDGAGAKPVHGDYNQRLGIIYFRCGDEHVMRHEMFHALARAMGLPYWRTIDHRPGHTLDGRIQ